MSKVFLVEDEDDEFGGTFVHVYDPENGLSTDGYSVIKDGPEYHVVQVTFRYKEGYMSQLEDWAAPLTITNTKVLLPIEFLMEVKG